VLEAALTAAQLAWLQQQEDFRADYLQEKPREILAATGS
jgi:hypothetical protein